MLRRVSVFAGPFDPAAAAAVRRRSARWGRPRRWPPGWAGLAEHSLLAAGPGPEGTRYRALEPVRQFGAEWLDAGATATAKASEHGTSRWCLTKADELEGGRQPGRAGLVRGVRRRRRATCARPSAGRQGLRYGRMPTGWRRRSPHCCLPGGGCVRPSSVTSRPQAWPRCAAAAATALECAAATAKSRLLGQEALRLDRAASAAFLAGPARPARPGGGWPAGAERISRSPAWRRGCPDRGGAAGPAGRGPRPRRNRSAGAGRRRHRRGQRRRPGHRRPPRPSSVAGAARQRRGSAAGQRRVSTTANSAGHRGRYRPGR